MCLCGWRGRKKPAWASLSRYRLAARLCGDMVAFLGAGFVLSFVATRVPLALSFISAEAMDKEKKHGRAFFFVELN